MKNCSVGDCPKVALARTYCDTHYARWRANGTVELLARPSLPERFWAKVEKSDGCWLWTGATGGSGYGIFGRFGRGHSPEGAHRMSWILEHGLIPTGMFVMHKCDVRLCVRPSHLQLGTSSENSIDMYSKGRAPAQTQLERFARGSSNPAAKLTESQVIEIRRRRESGETLVAIAADYGVSFGVIGRIASRETWHHI